MKRLLALLLLASGCAHENGVTLCSMPQGTGASPGTTLDSLAFDVFERLLLATRDDASTLCDGSPLAFPALPDGCAEPEPELRAIESPPASRNELVLRPAGGDFWLAFLPVRRYEGGLADGPIAILRYVDGRLDVRALGTLRAYPNRLRLEIAHVGSAYVLVADGESCDDAGTCVRATRLLLLEGQRFVARPLTSASGECLGAAWFPRAETRVARLGAHAERTFDRTVELAFEPEQVVVNEHIVVHDADPSDRALPARLFRRASVERLIHVTGAEGAFRTTGDSLFRAMLVDEASLAAPRDASDRASTAER